MKLKAVLFDTDNTLVFFDESEFFKHYFPKIRTYFSDIMPEELFQTRILATTKTLLDNNGSLSNLTFFMKEFSKGYEDKEKLIWERFTRFYKNEFHQFKNLATTIPDIRKTIKKLCSLNLRLVSASNPIWPENIQMMRLEWADIDPSSFNLITHIENMHFCKPRIEYYQEICKLIKIQPEECLMVGNDPLNDMMPSKIGMKTYLTTDWIRQNDSALTISHKIRKDYKAKLPNRDFTGPFSGIVEIVKNLI